MTVQSAEWKSTIAASVSSATGARHSFYAAFSHTLKSGAGAYLFDRVFSLSDYSLTVAAGNLDIDLYDLGSLDLGAGAGRDNLGLSHANARIIAFAIRHQEDGNSGSLRIDNNGVSSTAWEGIFHSSTVLDLAEGAFITAYLGESGKTVTDTTDHILRLSAQTGTCIIDVAFFSAQS